MNQTNKIREQLQALAEELHGLRKQAIEDQKPVALDQQSVGRLSRMDAMQIQAMNMATDARRLVELKRIEAALTRLQGGEYGYCVTCGEAISPARLAQNPAVPFCIHCA